MQRFVWTNVIDFIMMPIKNQAARLVLQSSMLSTSQESEYYAICTFWTKGHVVIWKSGH